ncbi:glutaredoxin 2 [Utexia brackfieldae]|uniref:glutaredoxin 2 n=1 Tax=Utexia brackfieldae TaxID=3074108 RepID=UPI00370DA0E9
MRLYVYDHCPYCTRARMIFGLKQIDIDLQFLLNDDEKTPISMVGKKMVPILHKDDGQFMPESLDIVKYVDNHNGQPVLTGALLTKMTALIHQLDNDAFRKLCSPRFVRTALPEFATASARDYFSDKKQQTQGDFQQCIEDTPVLLKHITPILAQIEKEIKSPKACNGELSIDDICLFPLLRNLSIVKGLSFPPKVTAYMQEMSKLTHIPLFLDRAI